MKQNNKTNNKAQNLFSTDILSILSRNLIQNATPTTMFQILSLSALLLLAVEQVHSFSIAPTTRISTKTSTSSSLNAVLNLELEKPLGIILEEMEEGGSEGVKVEELSDAGSAYASEYRNQLIGLKIATVMDQDVTSE